MIQLLALLLMVSLTVYIVKSAEPIYRFIQRKISLYQEKKKIKKQTFLLETRGIELLTQGYEALETPRGVEFTKRNCMLLSENHLRGYSDKQFNEIVYGKSKKE